MTIERLVRIFAGSFILLSLVLAHLGGTVDLAGASWLWLTAFVGLNLFQSGFTNFCPLVNMLRKAGFREASQSCCN